VLPMLVTVMVAVISASAANKRKEHVSNIPITAVVGSAQGLVNTSKAQQSRCMLKSPTSVSVCSHHDQQQQLLLLAYNTRACRKVQPSHLLLWLLQVKETCADPALVLLLIKLMLTAASNTHFQHSQLTSSCGCCR
jgi:hypothetical protein